MNGDRKTLLLKLRDIAATAKIRSLRAVGQRMEKRPVPSRPANGPEASYVICEMSAEEAFCR